ncbi:hypothetical protein U1Q18_031357 [Sarracenia purpurea var. burkii]
MKDERLTTNSGGKNGFKEVRAEAGELRWGDEVQVSDKIPQSNSKRPAAGEVAMFEIDESEEGTESDEDDEGDTEDEDASALDDDNDEETGESAEDDDPAVHDRAVSIVDNQVTGGELGAIASKEGLGAHEVFDKMSKQVLIHNRDGNIPKALSRINHFDKASEYSVDGCKECGEKGGINWVVYPNNSKEGKAQKN